MVAIQEFNRSAVDLWGREPKLGNTDEQFRGVFKFYLPDGTFIPHAQTPMTQMLSGKIPVVSDVEVVIERPDVEADNSETGSGKISS